MAEIAVLQRARARKTRAKTPPSPLQEEIACVAYQLYEDSGRADGRDVEHWLEAERLVFARHAGSSI